MESRLKERLERSVDCCNVRDVVADAGLDVVITKNPSTRKRSSNTTWEIKERGRSREDSKYRGFAL